MIFQRTLKRSVTIQGIGLHSGQKATLTLKPARPNRGIVFIRTDLPGFPQIVAHYKNIVSTQLATTLGRGNVTISTVEHVLAALQGLSIDNAFIEVDGSEVPILDGSSAQFYKEIQEVGIQTQLQSRPYLFLRRRVEFKLGERWAMAEPSSRLEIHSSIEWDHPSIGYQEFHYVENNAHFSELANARTFCLLKDVESMKQKGLARGGSLENAIVLDDTVVLNPEGLRFPDEFVRHKVLDALGDFKLAGIAIQAHFRLHRSGHELHSQILAKILNNSDNFEIIDSVPETNRHISLAQAALTRAASLVATY